jgi:UDP-N-acetylglucosamine 2-epimerase
MAKKVMVIIGTRPEATKMGPVIRELKNHPEWFETRVVATGQHREQLDRWTGFTSRRPTPVRFLTRMRASTR